MLRDVLASRFRVGQLIAWLTLAAAAGPPASAAVIDATPGDYRQKIPALQPGDTLRLAAGTYSRMTINDLNGRPDQWIVIEGPSDGQPALIAGESCCNTVQIRRSSYLIIRNLTIDSLGIAGLDGINAKDGISHHVVIENNHIRGVGGSQQTVGISTKSPAWGWVVRGNTIVEPGTGMYFGNSDGSAPFIAGVVEHNLVSRPIGYGIQVKHQNPYSLAEAPAGPNKTIIRHNVIIKDDRPSPDGDRPNLLVGSFPASGMGSSDSYEIHGNFFFGNPRESLIQASGRVVIHDNILVGPASTPSAILLMDHNGPLEVAYLYNNTIFGTDRGIRLGSAPRTDHLLLGNAILAQEPISGSVTKQRDNVMDSIDRAHHYFKNPTRSLGEMDFYPRTGELQGPPLDYPAAFSSHSGSGYDFNGRDKGAYRFRGAYAGDGENPGWRLDAGLKP